MPASTWCAIWRVVTSSVPILECLPCSIGNINNKSSWIKAWWAVTMPTIISGSCLWPLGPVWIILAMCPSRKPPFPIVNSGGPWWMEICNWENVENDSFLGLITLTLVHGTKLITHRRVWTLINDHMSCNKHVMQVISKSCTSLSMFTSCYCWPMTFVLLHNLLVAQVGSKCNTMRAAQTQCHVWFCVTGGSMARWIGSKVLHANDPPQLLLFPSGHHEEWGWGAYTCCSQVGMSQPKFSRYKVACHSKCNSRWSESHRNQQFVHNAMWGCANSVLLQELGACGAVTEQVIEGWLVWGSSANWQFSRTEG